MFSRNIHQNKPNQCTAGVALTSKRPQRQLGFNLRAQNVNDLDGKVTWKLLKMGVSKNRDTPPKTNMSPKKGLFQ